MQTCRRLEKKWRQEQTLDNHTAFKNTIRRHHQFIRTAKRTTFKERIDNNAQSYKELFNIVKELSNPGSNVNDIPPSQDLCDSVATFFYHKVSDIHESFNAQTPPATPTPQTYRPQQPPALLDPHQ
ncbi:hypothetical protein NDU88_004599 [Pleurodeles waltl]|uniref:Uncharacterized protein n=1 Tax=Pleurodeles waltl TaxID=8319 RepID=A0AAV7L1W2_PLEWA|nr:hypothetical protein NDU88_004599 [Pleurodeles waltl]